MSDTYAIVFKGEIVDGFDGAKVQAQLSKALKTDAKKTAALFSGKQIVLKKTVDKAEAAKYGKALKKLGADVKIKIIKAQAAAPVSPKLDAPAFQKAEAPVFQAADDAPAFQSADPEPALPKASAQPKTQAAPVTAAKPPGDETAGVESTPEIDTSGITVAPNEGDLFDPEPEAQAPDLDLSEYEVLENDGSPIVEPSEEVVVEIDLSAFSVKDNDGSPLVEASNEEAPRVEAPDFGLDEPGAMLETLKEEKELLNPNTMGMTLAMPGEDLIADDEKPPTPPPVSPDTSKINLVPNFDL